MALLRTWAAPLGALLVVAAGALRLWVPWLTRLQVALVIAGTLLVLVALVLNAREVGVWFGRRSTRYGLGAAVMVLLALGFVVLANALSIRHGTRWDLTANKRHSLSPQTIKILQGLKEPIDVIAFFRTDTPGKSAAEDLLKRYASHAGGKLTWRIEDPDRAPGLARRYGVETYGTVVLERAGKAPAGEPGKPAAADRTPLSEKVLDAEEEKLTSAIVKLTREGKRVVYVLKGHGEHDPASSERSGLSQAKQEMERANYEVRELTLAREPKVPDDAAVLIVPGPKVDLLPPELAALEAYLARGGKVLLMVNPFAAEGLKPVLARYGITLGDDLVLELNPIGQMFGVGPQVPVVTSYEPHPITRDLGEVMTLFPLTRSVEPAAQAPPGVTVQALARTSRESWGETDRNVFQKGSAAPDAGEKRGPLPVAAAATIEVKPPADPAGPAAAGGERRTPRARLVVLGTSNLAANQFLGVQGNRDFFLNAVAWLAEEEELLSIRPKDSRAAPIFLTSAQSQAVFILPVVALPLSVLLVGIVVVVRRRRAK